MTELSIVSPVSSAVKIVPELCSQVIVAAEKVTADFKIIVIDDGSPDGSWG